MSETIVTYTVTIRKAAKDMYYHTIDIQPGGSKLETKKILMKGEQVEATLETNPPVTKSGQALGIGQALNLVNDIVYAAIEEAGMVK